MDIMELCSEVDSFVQERGWYARGSEKPQVAKNLAVSIVLEASEILEHFQWRDEADPKDIGGELADVLIYAAQLANVLNINLESEVTRKLAINKTRVWDHR